MADDDATRVPVESLARERAMGQTETGPDAPSRAADADVWATARVVMPHTGKSSVHLRLDSDVLDWFRQQGRGHLTRMNAVLRSYMEAHKNR
jgi:uncharacterized protein (DUF4415 family)